MEWKPANIATVKKIVQDDLAECDDEQVSAFELYAVQPYLAPIIRYGKAESVIVVARMRDEVIYWEDVEEGFNVSPIAPDGRIPEHSCNQDDLGLALNAWVMGRGRQKYSE
jgi:hypothetical protein